MNDTYWGFSMKHFYTLSVMLTLLLPVSTSAQDTEAETILKSRNSQFSREIVQVAPNVYTAVGYSPANSSMIVGEDGVIIIDTGMTPNHSVPIIEAFREISDLPVRGIIYTHGHGDHTGGAIAFIGDEPPQIWAMDNFGIEDSPLIAAGLNIQRQRGIRQAGFALPDELRINNGIAPAMRPGNSNAFSANENASASTVPTHTFSGGREQIEIAGVSLELVAAPGETDDQLYVWYPAQKTLFAGDNLYRSFPNLYAIRGTPYRDVYAWVASLDLMLAEGAEAVVPGHTMPFIGAAEARNALQNYRDAVSYVHDKTVEGMNAGMTMDELAATVKLPEHLANNPDLGEYYGRVAWAVRSIFTGYLGWYDGNPSNLIPLTASEEAERLVDLVGGADMLLAAASSALSEGDAQWAAQLADHLIALDDDNADAKLVKAGALTVMARDSVNALGRNYYLTVANILREQAAVGNE